MDYSENKTMRKIGAENVSGLFNETMKQEMRDVFEAHKGIYSLDMIMHIYILGYVNGKKAGRNV